MREKVYEERGIEIRRTTGGRRERRKLRGLTGLCTGLKKKEESKDSPVRMRPLRDESVM
jgi:hypothetical protein